MMFSVNPYRWWQIAVGWSNNRSAARSAIEIEKARSLIRTRRANAVALWATIPPEKFYIGDWQTCALGLLGQRQFDGWTMGATVPRRGCKIGTSAGAAYFGLGEGASFHLFIPPDRATLVEISKRLLASPINIDDTILRDIKRYPNG